MVKKDKTSILVGLHGNCDYIDWLEELKQRDLSLRLKASCAVNSAMLEYYWTLGQGHSLQAICQHIQLCIESEKIVFYPYDQNSEKALVAAGYTIMPVNEYLTSKS